MPEPIRIPDEDIPEGYVRKVWAVSQPQYEPLPSLTGPDGVVFSRWSLTMDERRAIGDGANVELRIWTYGQPLQPHRLDIQGVDTLPPPPRDVLIRRGS